MWGHEFLFFQEISKKGKGLYHISLKDVMHALEIRGLGKLYVVRLKKKEGKK